MNSPNYSTRFSQAIRDLMRDALRVSLKEPATAAAMLRAARYQRRAAGMRRHNEARGLPVPALMIVSVTKRCNLNCKGCYARAQHREAGAELSTGELRRILAEARDLGVSIVLLAGGEPLTRPDLLDVTAEFPEMLFPLFTNGLLLDEPTLDRLAKQRHVIPVISLEGHQIDTDTRRGHGVHEHTLKVMDRLRARGLFYGTSLTLTSQNYATVSDRAYLSDLIDTGCRLFFFVEYVPVQPGTEFLVLADGQREALPGLLNDFRQELPGLFVALPGDEEQFGGCLAAGRGFIHVSSEGSLEPCPFAPFSDVNLRDASLEQALRSPFMAAIRESDAHLSETQGGCALWAQRDWVTGLLQGQTEPSEPVLEPVM